MLLLRNQIYFWHSGFPVLPVIDIIVSAQLPVDDLTPAAPAAPSLTSARFCERERSAETRCSRDRLLNVSGQSINSRRGSAGPRVFTELRETSNNPTAKVANTQLNEKSEIIQKPRWPYLPSKPRQTRLDSQEYVKLANTKTIFPSHFTALDITGRSLSTVQNNASVKNEDLGLIYNRSGDCD